MYDLSLTYRVPGVSWRGNNHFRFQGFVDMHQCDMGANNENKSIFKTGDSVKLYMDTLYGILELYDVGSDGRITRAFLDPSHFNDLLFDEP
uniref:AlNc14C11G1394 protein n=1 Tax=Albugo laibachii Nc14 TaxID=890382 RepID=F0W315_9STRA|nr:AlNc14C11G1394 [Albugo laibachii Nc14]|eukprot:CCA15452.1 AlNc14C11G1394 [Albugo laibachii Nc14]